MSLMSRLLYRVTNNLPCRIINDGETPYLERYYLCTLMGWRFYLHRFVNSDPDRGLHDHPWQRAFSIILVGWYWEQTRSGKHRVRWFNSLTGDTFHRVVLPMKWEVFGDGFSNDRVPCWTLFFHRTGRTKMWGFLHDVNDPEHEGCQIFQPYTYAREGKQDNWWLKTPKGRDAKGRAAA